MDKPLRGLQEQPHKAIQKCICTLMPVIFIPVCAKCWKGGLEFAPPGCLTARAHLPALQLMLAHSTHQGTACRVWLRKRQEKSVSKKKCYLVSSSNKAFTGEQKWFGPLTKCSLPKKIHAQAHMFQVAAGRSVAAHVSLQHFLFGSRLLFFLCLFIKLQIYRKVTLCNPRCFIALVNQLIVTRF